MFDVHLANAFREAGCPVCRIRRRAVARYIFHTLWENIGSVTFRQRFLAAEGLCPEHAWQLQAVEADHWHDGLGTAILYESLLSAVRRQLGHKLSTGRQQSFPWWHPARWRQRMSKPAPPASAPCPVCAIGESNEQFYAHELAARLQEAPWREAYRDSSGLCLAHLRMALAQATAETKGWLLAETESRLTTLHHDLNEYIRKHAWQHRDEPVSEAEQRSWVRAIAFLRGEKPAADGES